MVVLFRLLSINVKMEKPIKIKRIKK